MTTARRVKMEMFEIFDHVRLLASRFAASGVEPDEVWLGPAQEETVRQGFASDPILYGRPRGASIEGTKFAGLTIRLSTAPGIRVGKTFS